MGALPTMATPIIPEVPEPPAMMDPDKEGKVHKEAPLDVADSKKVAPKVSPAFTGMNHL